jgi:tRNA G18 (ribose-2'-O)-methylase SpoU
VWWEISNSRLSIDSDTCPYRRDALSATRWLPPADDRPRALAGLRDAGFRLLALTPDPAAVPIGEVERTGKIAILVGSEGDGLSERWLRAPDQAVRFR